MLHVRGVVTHSFFMSKPLAGGKVSPSTDLRLLSLPEFIIANVFSFLHVEDITRASLLCCRTLADIGKLDILWEREWRTLQRRATFGPTVNVVTVPSHLKGKLYRFCCKERTNRFHEKLNEFLKRRRVSISMYGPVRALRETILNDLQKGKAGHDRLSIAYFSAPEKGVAPFLCCRKIPHSHSGYASFNKFKIPLVNSARNIKTKVRVRCQSDNSLLVFY